MLRLIASLSGLFVLYSIVINNSGINAAEKTCKLPPEEHEFYKVSNGCLDEHGADKLCFALCFIEKLGLIVRNGDEATANYTRVDECIKMIPDENLQFAFNKVKKQCMKDLKLDLTKGCDALLRLGLCLKKIMKKECRNLHDELMN